MSGRQRTIMYLLVAATFVQSVHAFILQNELRDTRAELIQTKKDLLDITNTLVKFEDSTAKFMDHTNNTFGSILDILKGIAHR